MLQQTTKSKLLSRRSFRRRRRFIIVFCLIFFVINVILVYNRVDYVHINLRVGFGQVKQTEVTEAEPNFDEFLVTNVWDENSDVRCDLKSDRVLKAIDRAKTNECKRKLKTIGCLLQDQHDLHPITLPRQCPVDDPSRKGYWLGCYKDTWNNRILNVASFKLEITNSPEECMAHCLRMGQEVAGVEYKAECYCGSKSDIEERGERIENKKCDDQVCPGDLTETCGGWEAISVYETGYKAAGKYDVSYIPLGTDLKAQKPVKIAFLLQFNGRSVRQVKRMLKLIYRPEHFYYVHVDGRQDYMYREMLNLEKVLPRNFRVKRRRISSTWGGLSLLDVILDSVKDLLQMEDAYFDYLINFSEADMPVLSIEELQLMLTKHQGINFMAKDGQAPNKYITMQGLDRIFFECDNHVWLLGDRKFPDGIRITGGSDWFLFHRKFLQYAVLGQDTLVQGLKRMYRYALIPAESFFHTLAANSMFCTNTSSNNFKWVNWKRDQGCQCHYQIVDWCGCSPNVLMSETFRHLKRPESQTHLRYFARKFEATIDQRIIMEVESQVRRPGVDKLPSYIQQNLTALNSYWQNEYDSQDSKSAKDFRLPLFGSLMRGTKKKLSCSTNCTFSKASTLNVYRSNDVFKGLTLTFDARCGAGSNLPLEIFVKLRKYVRIYNDSHSLAASLISLDVGTDFDVKEEIFRNYVNVLTSGSKPILRHEWHKEGTKLNGTAFSVNVTWKDPNGIQKKSETVKLDSATGIQRSTLEISEKLSVGTWTARIEFNETLIADVKFAILYALEDEILPNFTKNSVEIDKLVKKFYIIDDICFISDAESADSAKKCTYVGGPLADCRSKEWSSFYPDPKSQIDGVDLEKGVLKP